jgi:shikimate kinase
MMGAGKSSVGRALAARLGREFVDTDAEIEKAAGASVREIFEREGEAVFRARERAAIDALAGRPVVVALGGGAIAQPGAAERLAASGTVVWLRARPETLAARVGDADARPLLRGLGPEARIARIAELAAAREASYRTARIAVDTDELDAERVAAAIAERL